MNNELKTSAWLSTGGRLYVDSAYVNKEDAERAEARRNDGSRLVPLYTLEDCAALNAEACARYREDAERYRWLREQDWFDGALCVVRDPKKVLTHGAGLGADCPSLHRLDAAIDAALKGQP